MRTEEETRLISDEVTTPKKSNKAKYVATTATGIAAGAVAGSGATAGAAVIADKVELTDIETPSEETPEENDNLLINNGDIRVAHVDDDMSFGEAFAQARSQVGPGGVFEWHGKLYGTYTAEEWASMSPAERSQYQQAVFNNHTESHDPQPKPEPEPKPEPKPEPESEPESEPTDNEIKVIGIEQLDNDNEIMNVAIVEIEGEQHLLVDVDNDGSIDVCFYDANNDGMIQENEVHDISQAGITVNDLREMQAAQQGDLLYASDDGMPDYIDNADTTFFA